MWGEDGSNREEQVFIKEEEISWKEVSTRYLGTRQGVIVFNSGK